MKKTNNMNDIPEIMPDNIYPVGPRLLLEVFTQAKETKSGLEMAEGDGHATPTVGRVIRTGSKDSPYKAGDVLMWRRYGIDNIKVYTADGDKEVYLLEENEVIARVVDSSSSVDGKVEPVKRGDYSQINEKQNASRPSKEEQNGERKESSTEKDSTEKEK